MFIKSAGGQFVDVSGNSGLDSANDGRSIGVLDFDKDGLQDFLLTNTNKQTLILFRNQIGNLNRENNFLAVRFVGGNRAGKPSSEFSARDGVGTCVTVEAGQTRITRELRCGEGLAAQNSRSLIVGLGDVSVATSIEVSWPSGKTKRIEDVQSQSVVTFYENESETKDGSGVAIEPYRKVEIRHTVADSTKSRFPLEHASDDSAVRVFTAMATWCDSCKKHFPDFMRIDEAFDGSIPVYAIPIDVKDDSEKLAEYMQKFSPAYNLLNPDENRGKQFIEFVQQELGTAIVPFSVVVSADDTVMQVLHGVPTISGLRKALSHVEDVRRRTTE